MLDDGKVFEDLTERRSSGLCRPGEEVEKQQRDKAGNRGDNLVFGYRRREESYRDKHRRQRKEGQVARGEDSPLGISVDEEDGRIDAGEQNDNCHEAEATEKFAQNDLRYRKRRGQQELISPVLSLLGEGAHRNDRDHDHQDDGEVMEQGANDIFVEIETLYAPEILKVRIQSKEVTEPKQEIEDMPRIFLSIQMEKGKKVKKL